MTIDDIEVVQTAAEIQTTMLADLADPTVTGGSGMPTTAWQAGSVPRTLLAVQSEVSADFSQSKRDIAAGGFLSSASGDWLTLKADEDFLVERAGPVATIGVATLTDAGGGPHVIAAGTKLISDGASGHQYRNITGGTVPLNGTLSLLWQAVETGSLYNVGNGAITTLVTALAGVSVSNPATWLTAPGQAGSQAEGLLTITDGASSGPHVFNIGGLTVNDGAGHSYTNIAAVTVLDGGTAQVAIRATVVGVAHNVANNAITTVASAINSGGTPVAGITCTNSATTWIVTSGADEQTDEDLREECRDRWSTLGAGFNASAVEYTAKQASTSSPVTRVRVVTNPGGIAGTISVIVGSQAGVVAAGDIAIIQAYFDDDRTSLGSLLTVSSCTGLLVALVGTVRVKAAFTAIMQAQAQANLTKLEQSTPVGGDDDKGNALVWEEMISAIMGKSYDSSGNMTASYSALDVDITSVTVGGAPGTVGADIALAEDEIPDIDYSGLTWVGV